MREVMISSSVLILALTGLRALFRRRISRRVQYALWGLVLVRLLLPFPMPGARFSVMNGAERLGGAAAARLSPAPAVPYSDYIPNVPYPVGSPDSAPRDRGLGVEGVLRLVWAGGAVLTLGVFAGANLRFSRRVRRERAAFDAPGCPLPVFVSAGAVSPCLFGVVRPVIYLTPGAAGLPSEKLRHVITHELCHFRHGDPVWSVLRCLVLAVYWFDPLVWLAAVLSRVDAEEACDEAAIRALGETERLAYGKTLVDMVAVRGVPSGMFCAATTMISGKKGLKRRLERIVRRPRTLVWALAITLLVAAALVGCTFTGAEPVVDAPVEIAPVEVEEVVVSPPGAAEEEPVQAEYTVTLIKDGGEVPVSGFDPELPGKIVFDGLVKSAAWPVGELAERPYRFQIRHTMATEDGVESRDYIVYRLDDGKAAIVMGGWYTTLNEELMAQLEMAAGITPGQIYDLEAAVSKAILGQMGNGLGACQTEAHVTLKTVEDGDSVTVYCRVLALGFDCDGVGLEEGSGSSGPAAITFSKGLDGAYVLDEYWTPMDGAYYVSSIREKFPADIADDAIDTQANILSLNQRCYAQAIAWYGLDLSGEIARTVDLLCNTPGWEEPSPYVEPGYLDYRQLLYYGDETLRYVFSEYLKGGQMGERDRVLGRLLCDLLGGENIDVVAADGQDYFDQWAAHVLRLRERNDLDYFREYAPKSYLLLEVMGETRPMAVDVPAPLSDAAVAGE